MKSLPNKLQSAIDQVAEQKPYKQVGNADSYSQYNEGWADACDIASQAVEQVAVDLERQEREVEKIKGCLLVIVLAIIIVCLIILFTF